MIDWADTVEPLMARRGTDLFFAARPGATDQPRWVLVTHMFNHQTHHRGQVHCMLTQAGGRPHDTDLPVHAAIERGESRLT